VLHYDKPLINDKNFFSKKLDKNLLMENQNWKGILIWPLAENYSCGKLNLIALSIIIGK